MRICVIVIRSKETLLKLFEKATKEKPLCLSEKEVDIFKDALREVRGQDNEAGFNYKKPISYLSPMSGKEVTCYSQRREEMKKYNVREVPPEEYDNKLKDSGFYDRRQPA